MRPMEINIMSKEKSSGGLKLSDENNRLRSETSQQCNINEKNVIVEQSTSKKQIPLIERWASEKNSVRIIKPAPTNK